MSESPVRHHFSVDVEEYFQVSAFERWVPRSEWDVLPSRVSESTRVILDLLEAHGVKGTFFTLGWVAVRHPDLIRRIASGGHELASHGWDHRRVTQLNRNEFRRQVRDSREILEDLSGQRVEGYRAPSFSIIRGREWALDILVEEGYRYDSSLYPVRRRGYGYATGSRVPHLLERRTGPLVELPPMTHRVVGLNLPAGGGGTFRQFPLAYTRSAFRRTASEGVPGTFYIHPWEVDPEQPRVSGVPFLTRLRHYRGIRASFPRLEALLETFEFRTMRRTAADVLSRIGALLLVLLASACVEAPWTGTVERRDGPPPELPSCPAPDVALEIDEIAEGLQVPWAMAAAPDGRVFLTERPGRIRVIEDGVLQESPWYTIDAEETPGLEIGLMGVALAPDFDRTGHLFVVSTHLRPEPLGGFPGLSWLLRRIRLRLPGDGGTPMVNRVHRITDRDGVGVEAELWVTDLPSGILHSGGALLAMPDRSLLLSLGDGADPWTAQDPRSLRGSILRIPSVDRPPARNRLDPHEHVVAMGVRNSQGLAFLDPDSSQVAFIDHGPSGLPAEDGRREKDELNLLGGREGRGAGDANFGWPVEAGIPTDPHFTPPLHEWARTLAPAGMAVLPLATNGESDSVMIRVLVTGLRGQALSEVRLRETGDSSGWEAVCQIPHLDSEHGRLRAIVATGPDEVLVGTSNRDGRGSPGDRDDRIFRIRW